MRKYLRRGRRSLLRKYWTRKIRRQAGFLLGPLPVKYESNVTAQTFLGRNVHFNGMRITGRGRVTIGDNFHSGEGCMMISQIHNYRGDMLPYDKTYIERPIVVEDNVWLGSRVMVLGGVRIGEG